MNTVARLVGPDGELVRQVEVEGLPPAIRVAQAGPVPFAYVACNDPDPIAATLVTTDYILEFAVPGDDWHPTFATYRRDPASKGTKQP